MRVLVTYHLCLLLSTVVGASAHLGLNLRRDHHSEDSSKPSTCNDAKKSKSCRKLKNKNGDPKCVWCKSKQATIPSECLTLEQFKKAPPSVFKCKSSNRLDFMELVETAPPLCDIGGKSGYVAIRESAYDQNGEDKHLFYWMFEKRNSDIADKSIPFVLWLTGGPGCSSSLALLTENGPCFVNPDGATTRLNPNSWTEVAHVLWLDQPAGVGFSYGETNDYNEEMISEDVYWFLQKFFETHVEFQDNPFFVFGESYGGHYVPAVTHRIHRYNQNVPEGAKVLPLTGLGIGNGYTDPEEQYKWYPEMAFHNSHGIKAVDKEGYEKMLSYVPACTRLIQICNGPEMPEDNYPCFAASAVCNAVTVPYDDSGLNPYDIRKECGPHPLCYDFTAVTSFLNAHKTKKALGVDPLRSHAWATCNDDVNGAFEVDEMKDFSHFVADLLNDDIPVIIYAGDVDFICNYMGNKAWTYQLEWKGGDDFRAAPEKEWNDGTGIARTAGGLTFLQIHDAGHMVPTDQPKVALEMFQTFVSGESFYSQSEKSGTTRPGAENSRSPF